jgi:hypothetical protein
VWIIDGVGHVPLVRYEMWDQVAKVIGSYYLIDIVVVLWNGLGNQYLYFHITQTQRVVALMEKW